MTDAPSSPLSHHDLKTRGGSGDPASDAAGWLCLAAAPTFAVMALWMGFFAGSAAPLCMDMRGAAPLNGMALMYALMSAFHAAPWLRRASRH